MRRRLDARTDKRESTSVLYRSSGAGGRAKWSCWAGALGCAVEDLWDERESPEFSARPPTGGEEGRKGEPLCRSVEKAHLPPP